VGAAPLSSTPHPDALRTTLRVAGITCVDPPHHSLTLAGGGIRERAFICDSPARKREREGTSNCLDWVSSTAASLQCPIRAEAG
jgi:hypothetical protein